MICEWNLKSSMRGAPAFSLQSGIPAAPHVSTMDHLSQPFNVREVSL